MKPVLLFFVFTAFSTITLAQQTTLRYELSYESPRMPLTIVDSTAYIHSNGRNSVILPLVKPPAYNHPGGGDYAYDTMFFYKVDNGQHKFISHSYRSFNPAGMMVEIRHEKMGSSGPVFDGKTTFSYNSAMLPDTIIRIDPVSGDSRKTFIYSGSKLVAQREESFFVPTNNWETKTIDSFITGGGPGSDSVSIRYFKNGGVFEEVTRNKYLRDANNNILIDSIFFYGGFEREMRFKYDMQGRLEMDSLSDWNSISSTMQFNFKRLYKYNQKSCLTSIKDINWYPGTPDKIDSFVYNKSNQIISHDVYDSFGSPYGGYRSQQYVYDDPLTIEGAFSASNLQIYPMPATSYVNVEMSFTKRQPFNVRIFDMEGRLVCQWHEDARDVYNKQISVTSMAPGQYMLHILAGDESCSKLFTIIR